MPDARMVFLGFGKYARADKIYAVEPITGDERGGGPPDARLDRGRAGPDHRRPHRADDPARHGPGSAASAPIIDEALELAERTRPSAEKGRVDLDDLGRRARRLLESTARPQDDEKLF